jgi:hypothetical protein
MPTTGRADGTNLIWRNLCLTSVVDPVAPYCILSVLLWCSDIQMRRVHAGGIVTGMAAVEALGHWAPVNLQSGHVRPK